MIAVGSLKEYDPALLEAILMAVRDALPARHTLHGFGITISSLERPAIAKAVDSADSTAYEYAEYRSEAPTDGGDWRAKAFHYLEQKRRLAWLNDGVKDSSVETGVTPDQRQLTDFVNQ